MVYLENEVVSLKICILLCLLCLFFFKLQVLKAVICIHLVSAGVGEDVQPVQSKRNWGCVCNNEKM